MNLIVQKSLTLNGQITLPSSKSQSIRGMFFALLSPGESILKNSLDSDDTRDAMRVCEQLGAKVTLQDNQLFFYSTGLPLKTDTDTIHTGNSGITTRFIMPLLGLRQNSGQPVILDCGEQMRARPIRPLVDALTQLGLTIRYLDKSGMLPVAVSGNLNGGKAEVAGITSQYLSALLISLPCAQNDSEITVNNLHERPYVEMTLNWLNEQKIKYTHQRIENSDVYQMKGGQKYHHFQTIITGDFSSASYFIAAGALTEGCVELYGLNMQDPQGDKRLVSILQEMGADIVIEPHRLVIQGGKELTGIKIDANDIPDLLPTLAVIGTQAKGKTEISHVPQARIKETDRIHSMTEGLKRLGAKIDEAADGMTVYQSKLCGAKVDGYADHRTIMALAMAGMFAEGETRVTGSDAINKTFPTFIRLMQTLGGKMEVINEE